MRYIMPSSLTWLLNDDHDHHHGHGHALSHDHHRLHDHDHTHDHRDHDHEKSATRTALRDNNLRAAYLRVLADALTSVMAIVALLAGRSYGWVWLDPVIGIVGGLVIARWSWGLVRDSGAVLLDYVHDATRSCRSKFAQRSKASLTKSSTCTSGSSDQDTTAPL